LGIDFGFSGWRCESGQRPVLFVRECAIPSLQGNPHALRMFPQLLQRDPRGRQLISVAGIDIALPELSAQTQPARQIEDDLCVRSRLPNRLDDRTPELHQRLRLGADIEADLEALAFE